MSVFTVPEEIHDAFATSSRYFETPLQQFVFYDKYSRYNYELGRRETWLETVDRAVNFLIELSQGKLSKKDYQEIRTYIREMKAMPSMRLLAMAGPAAKRNEVLLYNCSYLPVDSVQSFVEALMISMSGCGVGYSVEWQYVSKMPVVVEQTGQTLPTFVVPDTAEGWGEALRQGMEAWFGGYDVDFDLSLIRPQGAPLRTKGGRASGPEPLRLLLAFARERILARQGKQLRSLDAHDIMCMVGHCSISGGVRRTAMVSLFDFDDQEMRSCKDGDFEKDNWQRWNANNSAVWPNRPLDYTEIEKIMRDMVDGQRGEPGIFNRRAANLTKPTRRAYYDFGMNPCGEIYLRPFQFCNLSVAVARRDDTLETLKKKVRVAAIIGTIQSMATNFDHWLRPEWKRNCEEERLLGVDINGQMDSLAAQDPYNMWVLHEYATEVNKEYAKILGINQAAAVTCVKPSGNSSQLLNVSSGLHPRWSEYYIRNVRVSAATPIYKVLRDAGVPMSPENGQTEENATTWVIHFPVKAPDGSITRRHVSAIAQCEYWLRNKKYWTDHNPSVTITYREDEVDALIHWVYENQDRVGGMSFFPASDAKYAQSPYEEINREQYEQAAAEFPKEIDFSRLFMYEASDLTTAAQEVACMSGQCMLA